MVAYLPHHRRWDPDAHIHIDGSTIPGNPILGAAVADPINSTTTHISVKSQEERHTINIAELAAITVAL